jgi:hypothetical protein
MENRNGLLVEIQIASATGTAERDAAIASPAAGSDLRARVT